MRVPFVEIFSVSPGGEVRPKKTVVIGGVTVTPAVTLKRGASFLPVDIAANVGKDLEVEYQDKAIIVKSVYP